MLPSNILQDWEAPQIRPARGVCSVLVLLQGWKWDFVLGALLKLVGFHVVHLLDSVSIFPAVGTLRGPTTTLPHC